MTKKLLILLLCSLVTGCAAKVAELSKDGIAEVEYITPTYAADIKEAFDQVEKDLDNICKNYVDRLARSSVTTLSKGTTTLIIDTVTNEIVEAIKNKTRVKITFDCNKWQPRAE